MCAECADKTWEAAGVRCICKVAGGISAGGRGGILKGEGGILKAGWKGAVRGER